MRTPTVADVMTGNVITAREHTPYRELIEKLTRHSISAIPIVNTAGCVVGIVSEADLLCKMEFADGAHTRKMFEGRNHRVARAKSEADTAMQLMTVPVVTIHGEATTAAAAKLMNAHQVKRLPVVDDAGVLTGIVSRSDLLRVYLRSDEDIRWEIAEDLIRHTLWLDPALIHVEVDDGIVTLRGRVERQGTAALLSRLAAGVPGVVTVHSELTWDIEEGELHSVGYYRGHPFTAD